MHDYKRNYISNSKKISVLKKTVKLKLTRNWSLPFPIGSTVAPKKKLFNAKKKKL